MLMVSTKHTVRFVDDRKREHTIMIVTDSALSVTKETLPEPSRLVKHFLMGGK